MVNKTRSSYVIISFNNEGFITIDEMTNILNEMGDLTILDTEYNTFRGCRNLNNRNIYVKEYVFILKKQ
ncbi:MAG: hypothetical protein ACOCZ5_01595 [bacterium]